MRTNEILSLITRLETDATTLSPGRDEGIPWYCYFLLTYFNMQYVTEGFGLTIDLSFRQCFSERAACIFCHDVMGSELNR